MNQEVANASDSRVVQPEATSIVAAGQGMCPYTRELANNSFASAKQLKARAVIILNSSRPAALVCCHMVR
jgi:hypothetical protein